MEIKLTLTGTRQLPVEISKDELEALQDPNTEVKVTYIAEPVSVENPVDTDEQITIKLKAQHISTVRTTKYND